MGRATLEMCTPRGCGFERRALCCKAFHRLRHTGALGMPAGPQRAAGFMPAGPHEKCLLLAAARPGGGKPRRSYYEPPR